MNASSTHASTYSVHICVCVCVCLTFCVENYLPFWFFWCLHLQIFSCAHITFGFISFPFASFHMCVRNVRENYSHFISAAYREYTAWVIHSTYIYIDYNFCKQWRVIWFHYICICFSLFVLFSFMSLFLSFPLRIFVYFFCWILMWFVSISYGNSPREHIC